MVEKWVILATDNVIHIFSDIAFNILGYMAALVISSSSDVFIFVWSFSVLVYMVNIQ